MGARGHSAAAAAQFGWPALLRTATAAEYAQTSRWSIVRAHARGELVAIGRRGRGLVFERAEVDRWMRGDAVEASTSSAPAIAARRTSSPIAASLALIEQLGRGGRR